MWSVIESRQDAAEARLLSTARALSLAIERDFRGIVGALSAFATSPALGDNPLRPHDPAALHAQAVRIGQQYEATVAVLSPDGSQVLSSLRPLGVPMPTAASSTAVQRAFASGQAAIGDLVTGSLSGRPVVSVALPLMDGAGRVAGITVAAVGAERFRDLLAGQVMAEGAFAAVTDARAILVARSDEAHERLVGRPVRAENVQRFRDLEGGVYRAVDLEGVERVFGFAAVPSTEGWTVVVGEPAAYFDVIWRWPLFVLLASGTLAVVLGGLAATFVARRILRPVQQLSRHAEALAAGRQAPTAAGIPPAGIAELEILRRGFAEAELALRASERSLRSLNEALETRVRQEVAAREEAQARLAQAQRMEALGQLAGGIAHDFNNVLQAVGGGAKLIEDAADHPPRVRRIAGMVREAAGRGAAVTRRLLAFSRRADLRAESLDARELLEGMQEVLAHTLGGGIGVELTVEAGLPPVLADKGQLETVLVNLATNARDALRGQGTIALSAEAALIAREGAVRPLQLRPGAYVRLSVRDAGMGMSPAVLARASEPFFTTKPRGKGTGLGLAMARGFAEQSGGALAVESEVGRGTTVSIWLPVADEELQKTEHPAADRPGATRGTRGRLLIVDDEAVVREITAEGLRATGFTVRTVERATDALDLLDAGEEVDLLVSDLSMPEIDGLTLIRGAQHRRPGLPAILLTGFATDTAELALTGALSGAFSLVRKPVDVGALADRAAMLLEAENAAASKQSGPTE
ncbi:hybrid sensor histidine kinase/response regulator [Sabulicella rubraurantiaca]|uniref:hybrid sensor histidine kinase/response regulator n=1 Tax=Sabulicella rubraurantiaca TaxID=2811429 RepID=UPI001A9678BB|nr:cache domain-containing protein [Sabulicella rubraurantiaca]